MMHSHHLAAEPTIVPRHGFFRYRHSRVQQLVLVAILLGLSVVPGVSQAVSPDSTDAREIMSAVERRDKGDRMISRMEMSITDKINKDRLRVLQSRSVKVPGANKQLMIFESPADVRNTGLLTIDYDDGKKSDDQWLYLPNLHKSSRISGGGKAGSFMGTDLSYSDMTNKDPEQYDYKLLQQSVDVAGETCWLIESRPRTAKEQQETGYVKSEIWVSKNKLIPVQSKAWIKEGEKLKFTQFRDIRQVDGLWVAHQIVVRTTKGADIQSTTVIKFLSLRYNQPEVVPTDFVEARLERGL